MMGKSYHAERLGKDKTFSRKGAKAQRRTSISLRIMIDLTRKRSELCGFSLRLCAFARDYSLLASNSE
jgi:hypothetical protein